MASEIHGLDAIQAKLSKLPERLGRNAMRRSLRKGANIIRDAARSNARRYDDPSTPENIAKNIVSQNGGRKMERQLGGPVVRVGVLGGAKKKKGESGGKANPGGETWYWRLLEFGFTLPSGKHYPAQSFMRRAAAEKSGAAMDAIVSAMSTELDKELSKL